MFATKTHTLRIIDLSDENGKDIRLEHLIDGEFETLHEFPSKAAAARRKKYLTKFYRNHGHTVN